METLRLLKVEFVVLVALVNDVHQWVSVMCLPVQPRVSLSSSSDCPSGGPTCITRLGSHVS
jgi:hypothetical protein